MTYTVPNFENSTGLTDIYLQINSIEPMYLIFVWLASYVFMFLLMSRISGMKTSFMTTSLIQIFITAFLMTMGLGGLYLFITSSIFVVSLFTYWWGG